MALQKNLPLCKGFSMDIEDLDPDIAALLNSTEMEDTETSSIADMGDNFPSPDYDFSSGDRKSTRLNSSHL